MPFAHHPKIHTLQSLRRIRRVEDLPFKAVEGETRMIANHLAMEKIAQAQGLEAMVGQRKEALSTDYYFDLGREIEYRDPDPDTVKREIAPIPFANCKAAVEFDPFDANYHIRIVDNEGRKLIIAGISDELGNCHVPKNKVLPTLMKIAEHTINRTPGYPSGYHRR